MNILRITDKEFKQFGKPLKLDTSEIVAVAERISMPDYGSLYVASHGAFESLSIMETIKNQCFGGLPTQLGYCYGHSNMLNALEWHKCSEVNIAVTDLILLLGDVRDIEEGNKYNSDKVKAFKVLKGEAIEVYSTTLHFCPVETSNEGFGCVVGLLKGTNTDLEFEPDDKLLFRTNKWIMAHNENQSLIGRGVVGGIYGVNHKICEG